MCDVRVIMVWVIDHGGIDEKMLMLMGALVASQYIIHQLHP